MPTRLTCPDCKLDLPTVESGSVTAHRCARCRGVWLDPAAFQRLCEEESRPPDAADALAPSTRTQGRRRGPPQDARVRYRPCPACGEVMSRSAFARVSGVVLDVCRAHGAWFDRGELAAIRRFLREGGLRRYDRTRRLDGDGRPPAAPPARAGSLDDLYDALVGGDDGWDVPRRPGPLAPVLLAAAGGLFLWSSFQPRGCGGFGDAGAGFGVACLNFAWRASRRWRAR